jgi:carbon-monoxide dehydrogenase small subunit
MTVRFILNGEDVETSVPANERLVTILRERFNLTGAKCGCLIGACGACSVLFIDASEKKAAREKKRDEVRRVVPACLVPAFRVHGSEVVTIEGFSTNDEFEDIAQGFAQAGAENCGYCDAGKIFAAEALLQKNLSPDREEFITAFRGIKCRCTEPEALYAGVLAAGDIRRKRIYGRSA